MAESFEIAEGHVTIKTRVDGKQADVAATDAGKQFVRRMQKASDDEAKKASKGFMANLVKRLFTRDPKLYQTLQHPLEVVFARPIAALFGVALATALSGAIAAAISAAVLGGLGAGVLAAGTAILLGNEKLQKKFAKERLTQVRQDSALELRIMRANLRERILGLQRAGASEEVIRHARLQGESEISAKVLETNAKIKAASKATTQTVTEMFKKAATDIGGSLTRAALPLVGPIQKGLATLTKWVQRMEPSFERLFAAAAPIIPILTDTFTRMAEAILPTIIQIMPTVVKLFEILAARSPEIAEAINQFLLIMAEPATLEAFGLLLTGLIHSINLAGDILGLFTRGFVSDMRDIEKAVHFVRDLPRRFEEAWDRVVEVVKMRAGLVRDWWNRTWDGIAGSVDRTWDGIVGDIDEWWDTIVERARALPGKVSDALSDLPGRLLDNFAFALGWVGGQLWNLGAGIFNFFRDLPRRFSEAWEHTTDTVERQGGQLVDWFERLPGNIGRALSGFGRELASRFDRAWDNTYETVTRRGGQFLTWVNNLPQSIHERLQDLAKTLRERFERAWDSTWEVVTRRGGQLLDWVGRLPRNIGNALNDLEERIVNKFAEGWEAATGTSRTKVKAIIDWIRFIPQRASDAMNSLAQKLRERAISGWNSFMTSTRNWWTNTARPWLVNLPGNMTKALGNAGTKLREWGRQVMQGLLVGVQARIREIGGLGSWFKKNVVDPIVGAVKRFFGIKSPSKVFQGIGQFLIAGLWKGMSASNPSKMIGRIFGGMDDALLALVQKGLINLQSIPGRVLQKLGGLFDDIFGGGGGTSAGLAGFARAAFAIFRNMFPNMMIGGWRARGSVPGSDHPKGKALDLMTTNPLIHRLLIEIGKKLPGAKYWISMRKIAMAREGWRPRPYHGPSPHTDHVHWCVPLDVDILTRRGWISYDQLVEGDETPGFNFETKRTEWTRVTGVVEYDAAEVFEARSRSWSVRATAGHRWVGYDKRTGRYGWTWMNAPGEHTWQVAAPMDNGAGLDVTLNEAELLGWLLTDGSQWRANAPCSFDGCKGFATSYGLCPQHRRQQRDGKQLKPLRQYTTQYEKQSDVHVFVWQTKPSGVARLAEILGSDASWNGKGYRLKSSYARDLLNRAGLTNIKNANELYDMTFRMTSEQRQALLAGVIGGDGHISPAGDVKIYQDAGPLCDFIATLAYLCGYRTMLTKRNFNDGLQRNGINMLIRLAKGRGTLGRASTHRQGRRSLGRMPVWCPTTELGSWTARFDGQPVLTGNSFFHKGGRLPEDIVGVGASGRRYKMLQGETIIQRQGGSDTINQGGMTIQNLIVQVDASELRTQQALERFVHDIERTARLAGIRPRTRLGMATS